MQHSCLLIEIIPLTNGLFDINISIRDSEQGANLGYGLVKTHSGSYLKLIKVLKPLKFYIKDNITVSYHANSDTSAAIAQNILNLLKNVFPELLVSLTVENMDSDLDLSVDLSMLDTFFNGLRCYITGLYPDNIRHRGIKHVYGGPKALDAVQEQLQYDLSVNCGLISYDSYSELPFIAESCFTSDSTCDSVTISSNKAQKTVEVTHIPYHLVMKSQKKILDAFSKGALCITELCSDKDFSAFKHRLMRFAREGSMELYEALTTQKDECMWHSEAGCTYNSMTRLSLEKPEMFDSNICHLHVGEKLPSLHQLKSIKSKAYIQRKCKQCSANKYCSKCINALGDEPTLRYFCEAQKEGNIASTFLFVKSVLKSFIGSLAGAVSIDSENSILCSIPGHSLFNRSQNDSQEYYQRGVLLFQYGNTYYVYNTISLKYYKVNHTVASIVESLSYGQTLKESFKYVTSQISEYDYLGVVDALQRKSIISMM